MFIPSFLPGAKLESEYENAAKSAGCPKIRFEYSSLAAQSLNSPILGDRILIGTA